VSVARRDQACGRRVVGDRDGLTASHLVRVEGYRFGRIVVDGEEQTRDVIILPARMVPSRWRAEGHALVLDDLGDVLDDLPERLIVVVARTDEAVRLFADADPATTAAALHLTC